jgi:hypothetical protein
MYVSPFVRAVALAVLGCGLAAAPAKASLIVYDFSVAPSFGPLAGQALQGRFVYDSSIVPAGGSGSVTSGTGGSALRSFQLDLGDTRFTAGNIKATLDFSGGGLQRFRIGETGAQSNDGTDYFYMDSFFGWGEFRLAGNTTLYGGALNAQVVNPQIDRYTFSIGAPVQNGPLAGQNPTGSFAVDHAIAQPNTLLVDQNDRQNLNALLDFRFTFDGTEHTTATANIEELGFDANGVVNQFLIGLGDGVTDFTTTTSRVGDFQLLRLADGPSLAIYQATGGTGTDVEQLLFAPDLSPPIPDVVPNIQLVVVRPPRGGYPVSIQTAPLPTAEVAEPAALAMLGLGFAALLSLRRGRAGRLIQLTHAGDGADIRLIRCAA